MADNNKKYGRLVSDEKYIQSVIEDMQYNIDNHYKGTSEYSEDGMKEIISDKLDDLGIYPTDIDYVFSELKF
jgi:hypothetical protein